MIIKKQKDSRLYNSTLKFYISYEDIKEYIISEDKFKVIDHNNKDITEKVMLAVATKYYDELIGLFEFNLKVYFTK